MDIRRSYSELAKQSSLLFVFYRRRAHLVSEVLQHLANWVFAVRSTKSERKAIELTRFDPFLGRARALPVRDRLSTYFCTLGELLLAEAGLLTGTP